MEQRLPESARPSGLNILVVEDNTDTADALVALLELEGHHAWLAADGMTALEMARQHELDVVLLDIGLPELNGYEVARRLTRQRHADGLRIIALSGYGDDMHQGQADASGIHQFLVKPVGLEQLRQALSPDRKSLETATQPFPENSVASLFAFFLSISTVSVCITSDGEREPKQAGSTALGPA